MKSLFLSIIPGLDDTFLMYIGIGVAALIALIVIISIVVAISKKKKKAKLSVQNIVQQQIETEETVKAEQIIAEEPVPTTHQAVEQVVEECAVQEAIKEEQPVLQDKPAEEEPVVNEESKDDGDENDDDEEEDDAPIRTVTRIDGHVRYIIIKYNKSFTAKIIQSSDEVKAYYSEIKNELLSYKGVKARMSWKGETFYAGRTTYAKICVRGKSLGLFLALDAKDYEDSKYIVDDMSEIATYEKTPCLYRIKNDRRLKYSKELIETVMQERQKLPDPEITDWAEQYPYEKIEPLIERGLVKVLTTEDAQSGDVFKPRDYVAASEVDELMQDEVAVALIEENEEITDKTKSDIVNIDILSKVFENGETATLEEMKKRIPAINKKATCIKVLARGTLDKKLTVIADSYSIEAAKMILLTGGNAVKKKNS